MVSTAKANQIPVPKVISGRTCKQQILNLEERSRSEEFINVPKTAVFNEFRLVNLFQTSH